MGSGAAALWGSRETLVGALADPDRRVRVVFPFVVALCLAVTLVLGAPSFSSRTHRPAGGASRAESVNGGLQTATSAALGDAGTAYLVHPDGGSLNAANPAQGLRVRFARDGVQVRAAHATIGLALRGIGRGSSLQAVGTVAPRSRSNRVVYRHPGFSEWYANGPLGLEQGFSVDRAPSRAGRGPLTLVMELSGGMRGTLLDGQRGLVLAGPHGALLRYDGLTATDARGHELPTWLQLRGDRLILRVDTQHASYPIRVDPFVQQGDSLTGGESWDGGNFGASVALSADGDTALVGEPESNGRVGAAWVFTRSGSTWVEQARLTGAGERGLAQFGTAVALSADGNTALIGGIGDDKDTGAVWVFTRSGSTWSQQGGKLVGSLPEAEGRFGQSVALSGDGATALVGCGPFYGHGGGVWVFTGSGSTWSQQGPRINPSGEVGEGEFGSSVALSSDGNTALIGALRDDHGVGAAWVFTRAGQEWGQQGAKLTGGEESGSEGFGSADFGSSVALSGEGDTAMIGGPADTNESGAVWAFVRSGSTWLQQGPKLTAGEGVSGYYDGLGGSVALSASGDIAVVGGDGMVLERSGSTWQEAQRRLFVGEATEREYGGDVALSADGTTALIGSPGAAVGNEASEGRAYVYTTVPEPPRTVTGAATAVGTGSATLSAKVNPDATKISACEFEYGTSLPYEHSVPCESPPGSGESLVAVSAAVGGLSQDTSYHFRLVATNAVGTTDGEDETFRTRPLVPSFTWSGGFPRWRENPFDWSLAANWLEAEAPNSEEKVSTLSFPRLPFCEGETQYEACYDSFNNLSGLSAESLRLDDADDYEIAGNGISIGSGGLTAAPASGSLGPAGDLIATPLELGASQEWHLSGRGSLAEEAGLLLAGSVTGTGSALEIGLAEDPVLYFDENDTEVGPLTIAGADPSQPGALNGVVGLLGGAVNATDRQAVNVDHVFLAGSGALGGLTTLDSELEVGAPAGAIEATSATLDPGSRLTFNVIGSGASPGTDYSHLVSGGAVTLDSAQLSVAVGPSKAGAACPTLARGRIYTLISTTGGLTGAFADAPVGGPELPVRYAEACPQRSQTVRVGYHESGPVQTVTATVEEAAVGAEEDAAARRGAEAGGARRWTAEEAFADALGETVLTPGGRAEEAAARIAAAASVAARGHAATPTTGVAAKGAQVGLASTTLLPSRSGYLSAKLSCPAGRSSCVGALTLQASNTAAGRSGARSVPARAGEPPATLADGRFSLAQGRTTTVLMRLTAAGRRLLSNHPELRARITIEVRDLNGAWQASVASVGVALPRPR